MKTLAIAALAALMLVGPAQAQDDALGLYFSDTEFTEETASADITPGFLLVAYIVLTSPTGTVVDGYEVGISCTAPDFAIPLTGLQFFDQNLGTNTNQIVTFGTPKPVAAGGTVMTSVFLGTGSTELEEISFGPSDPSSLPDGRPVVAYGDLGLVACSYPWGDPVVARLNAEPVSVDQRSWSRLRALFE
jgi:hypothetical protein